MSRRPAPAAKVAAAALASAVVLTGCGTGLDAMTYKHAGRQDGASVDVGGRQGVKVRHLHVTPPLEGSTIPAGDSALVIGGLSNAGGQADALVGAASPAATGAVLLVGGEEVGEIAIPAGAAAPLDWAVRLDGLTAELHVAERIDLTLVFRNAGRVTVPVQVLPGQNGLEEREPAQDPNEGGH